MIGVLLGVLVRNLLGRGMLEVWEMVGREWFFGRARLLEGMGGWLCLLISLANRANQAG